MSILQALNDNLADVASRTLVSLVQVSNGRRGNGAGIIWRADGLVITNAHVVLPGRGPAADSQLAVTLRDGRTVAAQLLAYDRQADLAALRVTASDLTPIELGDSRRLAAGDFVLALGFPWGVHGGATSGIVIGAGAGLPEMDGRDWLAASLHLRPGHSGGPLVDSQGRLVGINTLMSGPEVGVAIPVHVAVAFVDAMDAQAAKPPTPSVVIV
jgi:serine protease Do